MQYGRDTPRLISERSFRYGVAVMLRTDCWGQTPRPRSLRVAVSI